MKWLIGAIILAIVSIVGISIYLQPNSFMSCGVSPEMGSTACDEADAIVVVSGGDTQARTAAGIALYNEGWADTLVFSGAAFDKSGPSNAAVMKQQATDAGVNENDIIIDEEAETTQQNAANTQTIFRDRNIEEVILVTSGYHQRRAHLEFEKQANTVEVRDYPVVQDNDWDWFWWATPRGWWLAGGELVKIVAFHVGVSS